MCPESRSLDLRLPLFVFGLLDFVLLYNPFDFLSTSAGTQCPRLIVTLVLNNGN